MYTREQVLDVKNRNIEEKFAAAKRQRPWAFERRLSLSWSNWGFGMEELRASVKRLRDAELTNIELHGNHYGPDLGYDLKSTKEILNDEGVRVAGICGMFSHDNDLSSTRAQHRQAAIEYVRREADFGREIGAQYLLLVPGAVGRPRAYDDMEFERSVRTARVCAEFLSESGLRGAVEPIRAAETSLVHTVADAQRYLQAVDRESIAYINGDVYHMQTEESHIGEAILQAGDRLVNLHMADSNRRALGLGSLDIKTIIRSLYLLGFNSDGHYVTFEPLGPTGDPYPAMFGKPNSKELDDMVKQSVTYFKECEEAVLAC